MKSLFKAALSCAMIALMLSGCMSKTNVETSSSQLETKSETTAGITSASAKLPENGELTKTLGEKLDKIFADGSYYFKEIVKVDYPDDSSDEDTILVHVTSADGNTIYVDTDEFNIDDEESVNNYKTENGTLSKDGVVYSLNNEDKKATILSECNIAFGIVAEQYGNGNVPQSDYTYDKTTTVEEDGVSLICESFKGDYGVFEYYFDEERNFVKQVFLGEYYVSTETFEYSSEPDESLLTIPEDYAIIE